MTTYRCSTCHKLMKGPELVAKAIQVCPRCDTGRLRPVSAVSMDMVRDAEEAR